MVGIVCKGAFKTGIDGVKLTRPLLFVELTLKPQCPLVDFGKSTVFVTTVKFCVYNESIYSLRTSQLGSSNMLVSYPKKKVPSFIVGISGYMDLGSNAEENKKKITDPIVLLLEFLRYGVQDEDRIVDLLRKLVSDDHSYLVDVYRRSLRRWPGLEPRIPITVMCNLAPGVDQLVAEVVRQHKDELGLSLRCPLPFPADQYLSATTFLRQNSAGNVNLQRQVDFIRTLEDMCWVEADLHKGLKDPTKIPPKIRKALKAIPEDKMFPVMLGGDFDGTPTNPLDPDWTVCDIDLASDQLEQRWVADRDNRGAPERRRRRYRAAGDVMAVTAHAMIAIWDGADDGNNGVTGVVKTRLESPAGSPLLSQAGLRLPHGGPLFHVQMDRTKKGEDKPKIDLPEIRILHPLHLSNDESPDSQLIGGGQASDGKLQEDRLKQFARVGESLNAFCKIPANDKRAKAQFDKLMSADLQARLGEVCQADSRGSLATGQDFVGALKNVSAIRTRAAHLTREVFKPQLGRSILALFWLTILAASSLHVFTHWHAPHGSHGDHSAHVQPGHESDSVHNHDKDVHGQEVEDRLLEESDDGKKSGEGISNVSLLGGLTTDKTSNDEPRSAGTASEEQSVGAHDPAATVVTSGDVVAQDTAAVAHGAPAEHHPVEEIQRITGVRLWAGWFSLGCGIFAGVWFVRTRALHLEPRSHDARAIAEGLRVQFFWNLAGLGSSVSANYMSRYRSELDWIRSVIRSSSFPYHRWKNWFNGLPDALKLECLQVVNAKWVGVQAGYYSRQYLIEHHTVHRWHKTGTTLALSGVISFSWLLFRDSFSFIDWITPFTCNPLVGLAFLVAAFFWSWSLKWRKNRQSLNPARPSLFKSSFSEIFHAGKDVFTTENSWKDRLGKFPRLVHTVAEFFIPVSADEFSSQNSLTGRIGSSLRNFVGFLLPSMGIAILTWCVAGLLGTIESSPGFTGVLCIFGGMELLTGALSIAWVEKKLHSEHAYQYNTMANLYKVAKRQLDGRLSDLEQAIQDGDQLQKERLIKNVQTLLYELGQESLDEHAEWLLLHRARPMEPVMPG